MENDGVWRRGAVYRQTTLREDRLKSGDNGAEGAGSRASRGSRLLLTFIPTSSGDFFFFSHLAG